MMIPMVECSIDVELDQIGPSNTVVKKKKKKLLELGYPVFLSRPIRSSSSAGSSVRRLSVTPPPRSRPTTTEMAEFEPMLQEFVPGSDDELYTLGSYLNADGEALGVFCGAKAAADA